MFLCNYGGIHTQSPCVFGLAGVFFGDIMLKCCICSNFYLQNKSLNLKLLLERKKFPLIKNSY